MFRLLIGAGYQDSGADIAYVLKHQCNVGVISPKPNPDPRIDEDWCFADTESGILDAVSQGATHLWANTILFGQHPLQTSSKLDAVQQNLRVVGQPPSFVELFDDKNLVNEMLRRETGIQLPQAATMTNITDLEEIFSSKLRSFPIVAKPVRGRGSHGVKLCKDEKELRDHCTNLLEESPNIILEEYLAGQEATVTIMPPSSQKSEYWTLPIVTRFNHVDGIAPYNGVVAITRNSRVVSEREAEADATFKGLTKQCVAAANLLKCTAPIRIDARRFSEDPNSDFALFDVNMKPVSTISHTESSVLTITEHDRSRKTRQRRSGKPHGSGCRRSGLGLSTTPVVYP